MFFLILDQVQLIIWTNFNLDLVTNYKESSLGRASYSLRTNLVTGKSGISKVALDGSKD